MLPPPARCIASASARRQRYRPVSSVASPRSKSAARECAAGRRPSPRPAAFTASLQRSELRLGRRERGLDRCVLVTSQLTQAAAAPSARAASRTTARAAPGEHHAPAAVLDDRLGAREPDAGAAARDECHLAVEARHAACLLAILRDCERRESVESEPALAESHHRRAPARACASARRRPRAYRARPGTRGRARAFREASRRAPSETRSVLAGPGLLYRRAAL